MTTFNSNEKNIFHYLTFVTFRRVPIFKSEQTCRLFIDSLQETRKKHQVKLIAYVIMPDHIHLIVNPLNRDIELVGKELKGISGNKIIRWLKENRYKTSLEKLRLNKVGKKNHTYSVWQKRVKSVDLWSHKFIVQKINYIHLNPVRVNLCRHPAKWKWSSYNAYLRKTDSEIPICPDKKGFWSDIELEHGKRPFA